MPNTIDFPILWSTVESQFRGNLDGLHGSWHWRQVEKNALLLAQQNHLSDDDTLLARLFAVLHDSQRVNEDHDLGHGQRAAAYARSLNGTLFTLPPHALKKLANACEAHELGRTSPDPVIGTCWDADRLHLTRVGITPHASYMSTPTGQALARAGIR